MSWGTCYSGSNNIHFNFPAFMDDGRNFSNYEAGATLDNIIKKLDISMNFFIFSTKHIINILRIICQNLILI